MAKIIIALMFIIAVFLVVASATGVLLVSEIGYCKYGTTYSPISGKCEDVRVS